MRSVDRLEQQRRIERQKKDRQPPDEEIEEEMEFPRFVPLDVQKSLFDRDAEKTFGGLNTAPSVFDQSAVFHTHVEK